MRGYYAPRSDISLQSYIVFEIKFHIANNVKYNFTMSTISLDSTDLRLLDLLQQDASLTNKALAELAHVSPATCLRRVRHLEESGVIERRVAILSPVKLDNTLIAIVEITLDLQTQELLDAFEARVTGDAAVQQCYRVSGGADFVLILHIRDMAAYHACAHRLFASDMNVRNVRTLFNIHRAKCSLQLPLPARNG